MKFQSEVLCIMTISFQKITYKLFQIIKNKEYRQAIMSGVAAGVEHEPVLKGLTCNTIVDIGANCGQFALVSRECFPHAIIHSIEPLDEPAILFEKIFKDDPSVTLYHCAIGMQKATLQMHIAGKNDSSSLLPIGENQISLFPKTKERETRNVLVLPLEDIVDKKTILPPALLKIDVQGYELTVLKGCQSLLDKFVYIYVECSFIELYEGQAFANDVIQFLQSHGFSLKGVYNVFYSKSGQAIQGDFLFRRKSLLVNHAHTHPWH